MSDSRATAAPESVDDRVAYIAERMRELEWERGKSAKRIAALWGLPESTIRNYSAEAHRQVMTEVNAEEAGRETGIALRRVMHEALQDGDRTSVIRAAETWATISGAKAAEKHTVVDVNSVSPATAARLVRETFGEHAAKRDPDEASPGTDEVSGDPPGK